MELWKCLAKATIVTTFAFATGCAASAGSAGNSGLIEEGQAFVDSINGLSTVNGLSTTNGLKSLNGLSTTNGLSTVNGLQTMNGLSTMNGLQTLNGLSVDCTGKTPGVDCTGTPDGLMSAKTGLMKKDADIILASYLVRCALKDNDFITIMNSKGVLVPLEGELGLAPSWKTDKCDTACEEKVSACLMAFTNGDGVHVPLEMSGTFVNADGVTGTADDKVLTLGTGHSTAFPAQEVVVYGNLFSSPPVTSFCQGAGAVGVTPWWNVGGSQNTRMCTGQWDKDCPFLNVGECNVNIQNVWVGGSGKCTFPSTSKDTASTCKDKSGKAWNYPITTFVKSTQTN